MAKNLQNSPSLPDTDYGTLTYGQFLDPLWREVTQIGNGYAVTFTAPGATTSNDYGTDLVSHVVGAPSQPFSPFLGPISTPLINGLDAFAMQSGVGLGPVFSYSPPALGTATSYTIDIFRLRNNSGSSEFDWVFSAITYELSFKVPPGILSSGNTYIAEIGAFQAPWDVIDAAFGGGNVHRRM